MVEVQGHDQPVCFPLVSGKRLEGMSNYYSSLFGPIEGGGESTDSICHAFATWIRNQPQRWPIIDFHPLNTAHPFFRNIQQALHKQGYRIDAYSCFGNWYHPVEGKTYVEYLAHRPSRLRNTIRRSLAKAQKNGVLDIIIHQTPGPALESAIDDFTTIYQNSWKPEESHPKFIAELCRRSANEGWLRLGILKYNNEPIAAQIWIVYENKANIFKLAYIQNNNPISAGTLLTAEMMRHVIDEDHVDEIDYLTGDDAYKQDWMSDRRTRKGIVAFDLRTASGTFQYIKHLSGSLMKHLRPSR